MFSSKTSKVSDWLIPITFRILFPLLAFPVLIEFKVVLEISTLLNPFNSIWKLKESFRNVLTEQSVKTKEPIPKTDSAVIPMTAGELSYKK